jgi:hypothetical protein
MANRGVRRR